MNKNLLASLMFVAGIVFGAMVGAHFSLPSAPKACTEKALEYGLPENTSCRDVSRESWRRERAHALGLPLSATWHEIEAVEEKWRRERRAEDEKRQNEERIARAREVGLPDSATDEEIYEEESRQSRAEELGLPRKANEFDIRAATAVLNRENVAEYLDLPREAPWATIEKELNSYRNSLTRLLGLSPSAGLDQVEAELLRRKPRD